MFEFSVGDYCGACLVLDFIDGGHSVLVEFIEVLFGMTFSC